ncbi:hypothetical protein L3X38_003799 [Prunus dulcis]|uniref:Uncharacterized protein n=1 Tax=Prunus dulcis TaxID=3755 RepID=A0AAD4ZMQ5_PRUDU|nr:hypothetical protein L3X38_003799 [Prunus dulcis]
MWTSCCLSSQDVEKWKQNVLDFDDLPAEKEECSAEPPLKEEDSIKIGGMRSARDVLLKSPTEKLEDHDLLCEIVSAWSTHDPAAESRAVKRGVDSALLTPFGAKTIWNSSVVALSSAQLSELEKKNVELASKLSAKQTRYEKKIYDKLLARLRAHHKSADKSKFEATIDAYKLGYVHCTNGTAPFYAIEDGDIEALCPSLFLVQSEQVNVVNIKRIEEQAAEEAVAEENGVEESVADEMVADVAEQVFTRCIFVSVMVG